MGAERGVGRGGGYTRRGLDGVQVIEMWEWNYGEMEREREKEIV